MLGLKRGTVKLMPYDYEWKELYKKEEKLLYSLIGDYIADIQHVGSTSIEGLTAKPIMDIAVGVKSLKTAEDFKDILEGAGYKCRGDAGIPGRVFFVKGNDDFQTHYLHIEVYKGPLWENHIYFRDYLCSDEKVKEQYLKLKKVLAEKYSDDRYAYTNEKNEFITAVMKKAKEKYSKNK